MAIVGVKGLELPDFTL